MKKKEFKHIIRTISENPYLVLGSSLCSIIGVMFTIAQWNPFLWLGSFTSFFTFLILLIVRLTSTKNIKKSIIDDFTIQVEKLNEEYKKCYDNIQTVITPQYEQLDLALKPYINCVSTISENILGNKCSLCIKMIETQSIMNSDIDKWKAKTIARSQSTHPRRIANDNRSILIRDNSDFYDIITGLYNKGKVILEPLVILDLPKFVAFRIKDGNPYRNSTRDYERMYKSTIVCPIATEMEKVSSIIKQKIPGNVGAYYHVIGFLCWDSKDIIDKESDIEILVDFLDSVSDMLYPLLENYIVKQL